MKIKIGILNFETGNLKSLLQIFNKLDFYIDIIIIKNKNDFNKIDKLIIPGQGISKTFIIFLYKNDFFENFFKSILKKPTLSICVGKQILFNYSLENNCNNISLLNGYVKRFNNLKLNINKIPYIGWNRIKIIKNHFLLSGIPDLSYFYFSHSYYVDALNYNNIYSISKFDVKFPSIYIKDNILATQFHPEKSSKMGYKMTSNFIKWIP